MKNDEKTNGVGVLIVFLAFLSYYVSGSLLLPYGAGPDYTAHYDGADFIYQHGHLAVLPEDEEKLHFTVYGSTRTLRPPLSYLTAAIIAHALDWSGIDRRFLFRFGSALLCALTVSVIFCGTRRYFQNTWYATCAALLVGLLPQFTFIASHLNDDSAAIFSVSLLIYCLIRLVTNRPGRGIALLTGLAFGLVILSKFTAWLFLPFAGIALAFFARSQKPPFTSLILLFLLGLFAGGGWWLVFNVYHYGWADPLLFNISAQLAEQHQRLQPSDIRGFGAEGVTLLGLIIGNYQSFIGESLISAIGNLDWLRLKLGAPQYALYMSVVGTALVYFLLRLIVTGWRLIWATGDDSGRRLAFETILTGAIVFQFIMYARYNLTSEIQVQGKYLLPILFCPLLLFFSAVKAIERSCRMRFWWPLVTFGDPLRGIRVALVPWLSVAVIALVHIDALARFVVPFYRPPAQAIRVGGFNAVDLSNTAMVKRVENLSLKVTPAGWSITTQTDDAQILFKPKLCKIFSTNNIVKIGLESDHNGTLQLFWDSAGQFVARETVRSVTADIRTGENSLVMAAGIDQCGWIRLDPSNQAGKSLLLKSFSVAQLAINPKPFEFSH